MDIEADKFLSQRNINLSSNNDDNKNNSNKNDNLRATKGIFPINNSDGSSGENLPLLKPHPVGTCPSSNLIYSSKRRNVRSSSGSNRKRARRSRVTVEKKALPSRVKISV